MVATAMAYFLIIYMYHEIKLLNESTCEVILILSTMYTMCGNYNQEVIMCTMQILSDPKPSPPSGVGRGYL